MTVCPALNVILPPVSLFNSLSSFHVSLQYIFHKSVVFLYDQNIWFVYFSVLSSTLFSFPAFPEPVHLFVMFPWYSTCSSVNSQFYSLIVCYCSNGIRPILMYALSSIFYLFVIVPMILDLFLCIPSVLFSNCVFIAQISAAYRIVCYYCKVMTIWDIVCADPVMLSCLLGTAQFHKGVGTPKLIQRLIEWFS